VGKPEVPGMKKWLRISENALLMTAEIMVFAMVAGLLVSVFTTSCRTYKVENQDGMNRHGWKLFGLPLWTAEEPFKTPEQKVDDAVAGAAVQAATAKGEAAAAKAMEGVKSRERASWMTLWLALGCFLIMVGCIAAGIMVQGWKTFGLLAAASGGLGVFFLYLSFSLSLLVFLVVPVIAIAVIRLLYEFRDFAAIKPKKVSTP
jgi:membrane protein implicated in regulation of membrane protease activity